MKSYLLNRNILSNSSVKPPQNTPTDAQLNRLVEYIEDHPDLVNVSYTTANAAQWDELSVVVNNVINGKTRTGYDWWKVILNINKYYFNVILAKPILNIYIKFSFSLFMI